MGRGIDQDRGRECTRLEGREQGGSEGLLISARECGFEGGGGGPEKTIRVSIGVKDQSEKRSGMPGKAGHREVA